MAFVHRQSCEGVKSELDIFSVPPTVTSIESGQWMEHQSTASLDSGGPIEFLLPRSGDAYVDLANTYLFVRANVTKPDGSDLDTDNAVGPMNNWLHSLFGQVDVHLNDTLVTPSTNTYPCRGYIETALSYGADAKETQLTSQLWYKDTAGRMDSLGLADDDTANVGFINRRNYTTRSRVVEMMGRLHVDMFQQDLSYSTEWTSRSD